MKMKETNMTYEKSLEMTQACLCSIMSIIRAGFRGGFSGDIKDIDKFDLYKSADTVLRFVSAMREEIEQKGGGIE